MKKFISQILASSLILTQCTPLAYGVNPAELTAETLNHTENQTESLAPEAVTSTPPTTEEVVAQADEVLEDFHKMMRTFEETQTYGEFRAAFYTQVAIELAEQEEGAEGELEEDGDSEAEGVDSTSSTVTLLADTSNTDSIEDWVPIVKNNLLNPQYADIFIVNYENDDLSDYLALIYHESTVSNGGNLVEDFVSYQTINLSDSLQLEGDGLASEATFSMGENSKLFSLDTSADLEVEEDDNQNIQYSFFTRTTENQERVLDITSTFDDTDHVYVVVQTDTDSIVADLYPLTSDVESRIVLQESDSVYLFVSNTAEEETTGSATYDVVEGESYEITFNLKGCAFDDVLLDPNFITKTEAVGTVTYTASTASNGQLDLNYITGANAPTNGNYTFDGWYLYVEDELRKCTFDTVFEDATELYARWYNTVTFETDGDTSESIDPLLVYKEEPVTEPTSPTKDLHTFAYWYATGSDTAYTFDTSITDDLTLTAKWLTNVEIADFDLSSIPAPEIGENAVSGSIAVGDKPYDASVAWSESSEDPFSGPFVEGGIYTATITLMLNDTNSNIFVYDDNLSLDNTTSINVTIHEDGTATATITIVFDALTAESPDTFQVSFETNCDTEISQEDVDKDSTISQDTISALMSLTKTGYTLEGWYTDSSFTSEPWVLVADTEQNIEASTVTEVVTLYAKWVANEYTLTFNLDSGIWDETSPSTEDFKVTYDTAIGVLPTVTREGYRFDGWVVTVNEEEVILTDVANWVYHDESKSFQATAKWTQCYSVTINTIDDKGEATTRTLYYAPDEPNQSVDLSSYVSMDGYTFDGWTYDEGIITIDGDNTFTMPDSDVEITAKWLKNINLEPDFLEAIIKEPVIDDEPITDYTGSEEFEVVIAWTDGTNDLTTSFVENGEYTATITLTPKTDYTFVDYTSTSFTFPNSSTVTVSTTTPETPDTLTFTVTFPALTEKYSVKFMDDTNVVSSSFVVSGTELTAPTLSDKTGYTLEGWYDDEETKWIFDGDSPSTVTEAVTLYAKWVANTYNLTFNVNSGALADNSVPTENFTVTYDTAIGVLPTVTREGYTFAGWVITVDGKEVNLTTSIEPNWVYHDGSTTFTATATWTINSYSVNVVVQDADGNPIQNENGDDITITLTEKVNFGATVDLSDHVDITGYTFDDWTAVDSDDDSVSITDSSFTMPASNVTVTGTWTANTYDLTFDLNSGDLDEDSVPTENFKVTYDEEIVVLPTVTREGYTFAGWVITVDGKEVNLTTSIEPNWVYHDGSTTFTATAKWEKESKTVTITTIDNTGATITLTPSSHEIGIDVDLSEYTEIKGYTFVDWTVKDDSITIVNHKFTMPTSDVELTANWLKNVTIEDTETVYFLNTLIDEPVIDDAPIMGGSETGFTYEVVWTDGEGNELSSTDEFEKNTTYTGEITVAAKDGYFLDLSTGTDYNFETTSNGTLTGQFKLNDDGTYTISLTFPAVTAQYTVTYNVNEGTWEDEESSDSISVDDGESLIAPTDPTRTGYSFDGWYADSDLTVKWIFDSEATETISASIVEANTQLYAKWTEIKVTNVTIYHGSQSVGTVTLDLINSDPTTELTSKVAPETALEQGVTWTSGDDKIVTVAEDGTVTPLIVGETTITATSKSDTSVTATCTIIVKDTTVYATGVTLDKTELALDVYVTNTDTLKATVTPVDTVTHSTVTWVSSDTSVATVDEEGKVTAVKAGTATITATTVDGTEKTATCSVTVTDSTPIPVTGITITGDSNVMDLNALKDPNGHLLQLKATVSPSDATAQTVEWKSSATAVASVDKDGLVTAHQTGGPVTITATAGGVSATYTITIVNTTSGNTVTQVTLDKTSLSLDIYLQETANLTATVSPDTALDKSVTWSSSDDSVVKVSASGYVVPQGVGKATITVTTTDQKKSATCEVEVFSSEVIINKVQSVMVTTPDVTLDINEAVTGGASQTLTCEVYPANATNKAVKWSSSDTKIAYMSGNNVVGVSEGTVTITVTTEDGGFTDTLLVSVINSTVPVVPVSGISLNRATLSFDLSQGLSSTLTATVLPTTASNKSVNWVSSNTSVATVSDAGVVIPRSVGTATITVTTVDGKYSASCEVTVTTSGYTTYGYVVDEFDKAMEDLTVTLEQNGSTVYTTTTNSVGYYAFSNVTAGIYNLIVTNGNTTKTTAVSLAAADKELSTIVFLDNGVSTEITMSGSTSVLIVNGLQSVADSMAQDAAQVNLELSISSYSATSEKNRIIAKKSNEEIVGMYFDVDLEKYVTTTVGFTEKATLNEIDSLIEIILEIPSSYRHKSNYAIYRTHEETVDKLTTTANRDGEKITVSSDGSRLSILTNKFSTYALTFTDTAMYNPDRVYSVVLEKSINGENSTTDTVGSISLSNNRPEEGDVVVITPYPNYGFAVESVTVLDSSNKSIAVTSNSDGSYQYTQDVKDTTVKVSFVTTLNVESKPSNSSFIDVSVDDPFCEAVNKVAEYGLMTGTSDLLFSPYDPVTRGMIVTILYNLSGQVSFWGSDFTDVHETDYYASAVAWAQTAGVARGYDDGTFRPNQNVTREELAVILFNYANKFANVTDMVWYFPLSFTDNSSISSWANQATTWCVNKNLLDERYNNFFLPKSVSTRAEVAVALVNMITTEL